MTEYVKYFRTLREANAARQELWDPQGFAKDLDWRVNELGGEVGEVCNILKKLHRERCGVPGSRATVEQLAAELADVIICADLVAMQVGAPPVSFIGPVHGPFKNQYIRNLTRAGVVLLTYTGQLCGRALMGLADPKDMIDAVVDTARSIAAMESIGLGRVVEDKFNATSNKVGLPVRLEMVTGAAASPAFEA